MKPRPPTSPPSIVPVLDRNIAALLQRRKQYEHNRSRRERVADSIGRFAATTTSVYLHAVVFGAWIVINLGWTPLRRFDPSLVVLAMVASVEAIFLSTFVLMMQNRLAALAEQRAELDLQISLLAEHEVTRLLQLTTAIGSKLGVDLAADPELEDLKKDVVPEQVLDRLDAAANRDTGNRST